MSKKRTNCTSATAKVFPKVYFMTEKVGDRTFTVCGKVTRHNDKDAMRRIATDDGRFVIVPDVKHIKTLTVGWSICCNEDTYTETVGNRLALKRCGERPLAKMTSDYNGEFREDTVKAILRARLTYLEENCDKFLPGGRNYVKPYVRRKTITNE